MKRFVRQCGKQLHDTEGRPLLLKGVGLGNWLLPEGYMWKFFDKCDRPRRIEALIENLIGRQEAERFWRQFTDTYISYEDMRFIKQCGLNSVRLPLNARHLMFRDDNGRRLLEQGLEPVDRLVEWCSELGLFVILDMHAAPGGQTGTNIDDSESDRPLLFEQDIYRQDLLWLWSKLAARYADETAVAGYDLLNEPLPKWFSEYNDKVLPLYRELTEIIREADGNHLIILEGAHWATDWSIFEPLKDEPIDNCMLQFHKYWDNPDAESVRKYLDARESLGVPIFMGEGGENNISLYAGVFHMLEQHDVGWNFWTYKKLDTGNSPISVKSPKRWDELLSYISGGERPEDPGTIFAELLNNIRFYNTQINKDVMRHIMRKASLTIPAMYYDLIARSMGHASQVPLRAEDGADLRFIEPDGFVDFKHNDGSCNTDKERVCLAIAPGERFDYSFSAEGGEAVEIQCRSLSGGSISAGINGADTRAVPAQERMIPLEVGRAAEGKNVLHLEALGCEVEVEWVRIRQ